MKAHQLIISYLNYFIIHFAVIFESEDDGDFDYDYDDCDLRELIISLVSIQNYPLDHFIIFLDTL